MQTQVQAWQLQVQACPEDQRTSLQELKTYMDILWGMGQIGQDDGHENPVVIRGPEYL